jgi:hypothetical protein
MKKNTTFWGIAAAPFAAMMLAALLLMTSCPDAVSPDPGVAAALDAKVVGTMPDIVVQEWRTFDSLADMGAFLASAEANTAESPYGIKLSASVNTADFGGEGDKSGMWLLFNAFQGKYVALDLSQCVGASVSGGSSASLKARPDGDKLVMLTLPEGLIFIGNQSFKDCSSLVSVTMPEGVESIGDHAFKGCKSLASVNFPKELKTIGKNAFEYTAINSAKLPEGLVSIGDWAFANTKSLASVTFPESLVSIGGHAFNGSSITSAILGNKVTTLGSSVFQNCTSLQSAVIPSSLTTLSNFMFRGCSSLTSLALPALKQYIHWETFRGCVNVTFTVAGGGNYTAGENGKVLVDETNRIVVAPSLAGNVTLSGYAGVLGFVFTDNTKITSVKFAEGMEIGWELFGGCTNLTAVDFPSTMTAFIGSFGESSDKTKPTPIQTVILRANVVVPAPRDINDHDRIVYVPASLVSAYQDDPKWAQCDIRPIAD